MSTRTRKIELDSGRLYGYRILKGAEQKAALAAPTPKVGEKPGFKVGGKVGGKVPSKVAGKIGGKVPSF